MKSSKWSNGFMFVLGLCVVMGALLTSGCGQGGDTTAMAQVTSPPGPRTPTLEQAGATPIWDQVLSTGRFVVLSAFGGQAVLDNETGLVWQRSLNPIEIGTYQGAINLCNGETTGGRMGWRLPTVPELTSLVDPSITTLGALTLPPGHPFIDVFPKVDYFTLGTNDNPSTQTYLITLVRFVRTEGPPVMLSITLRFGNHSNAKVWCVRSGNPVVTE